MRRLLLIAALLLVSTTVASAAPEVLQDWVIDDDGAYNVYLHIQRIDLGSGWWHWEYSLDNSSTEPLKQFSVGFAEDPTGHITNFGYLLEGVAQAGFSTVPTTSNLLWLTGPSVIPIDATFGPRAQATFAFDTDWQYVTRANHQARDGVVTPAWSLRAVPSPAIPEPVTLVLGVLGLGTIAGIGRLRRR